MAASGARSKNSAQGSAASTGCAAVQTLTGPHLLPCAGEEGPRFDEVPGDGAVVVKAAAPAQQDGGVTDVSHHHTPGGAWRSCGDGRQTDVLLT